VAILLGGAAYLGWLSWRILGAILLVIAAGAGGYLVVVSSALRYCRQAREEEDKLFGFFRALTDGIKELKLHRHRRGAFFSRNIETVTANYQRHNVAAELRFAAAQSWSHLLYFALIGMVLFLAPRLGIFNRCIEQLPALWPGAGRAAKGPSPWSLACGTFHRDLPRGYI
jgi:putative ATP-binding cassette transporter